MFQQADHFLSVQLYLTDHPTCHFYTSGPVQGFQLAFMFFVQKLLAFYIKLFIAKFLSNAARYQRKVAEGVEVICRKKLSLTIFTFIWI